MRRIATAARSLGAAAYLGIATSILWAACSGCAGGLPRSTTEAVAPCPEQPPRHPFGPPMPAPEGQRLVQCNEDWEIGVRCCGFVTRDPEACVVTCDLLGGDRFESYATPCGVSDTAAEDHEPPIEVRL